MDTEFLKTFAALSPMEQLQMIRFSEKFDETEYAARRAKLDTPGSARSMNAALAKGKMETMGEGK